MTEAKKYDIYSLPYAHVFGINETGFGHVNVSVSNIIPRHYPSATPHLKITCQTGSSTNDHGGKSYAWGYGIAADYDLLNADHLADLLKLMRKIEKRLEKKEHPKSYGEYCQQILEAAGITVVFVRENFAKNLPYMTGVNDLPRFHTTLQSDALIAEITKLEHKALMATDRTYRANQEECLNP